ncbi:hypothetical protein N7490_000741 [Penicillium lividum]|nr:hypothetical protein N7490_000741 [Penicillium lividum]
MNNPFLLSLLPASQSLTNQRQSAEESQFTFAGLQGLDTLVQNPYFRLTGVKIYGQIPALYGEQGIPNLYSFDDTFDDDDSPFTAWRLHTITLSPKSPATVGDKEYYWKLARPQDRRTPLGEEYWAVALEYNDGTREFPIFLKTASWPELKKGVRGKEFIEIRSPSGKFYKLPRQGLKTIRIYAKQPELGELTTNVLVFENDLDQLLEARKALQDVQRKMGDWKLLYRFNPERQVFILDVLPQKKLSQNLPLDEEYVKLKISSDDLGYNPFGVSEHIYVPKSIIEAVSNYFRKPSNGLPDCLKNRPPPNSDECLFHGVQPKPEDEDSDKPYLWVRNDQGRPYRIWAVSPRTKVKPESSAWQEYWKDLYKAGIRSMGVGRPPRYLDPEIELFLLPEKSFEKEFGGWVNFINSELENTARTGNRAPQNNQTVTVIDQHPGTLLYKQIGTSPFGHYHTFVRKRVYDDYIEKHPSYQFPDMANEENGRFTHLLADRSKNPVLKAMEDAVKKIDLDNQVGWPTLLRSQRPFFTRFESELDMYILKVAFGVNSTKTVTPTKDSDVFATDEPSTSDTSRGESGMAEAKDPGTIFKESQGTQMEDADAGLPKKKLHIEQCPVSASSISVTGEFSPLHDELSLRI